MITLQNLFIGLVVNYRSLNLRYDPRWESMARWTAAEIAWLAKLGEDLGFIAVMEKQVFHRRNPVDLAWIDPFSGEVALHVERENSPLKLAHTIQGKLLPAGDSVARFTIAIFDEVKGDNFSTVEDLSVRAFRGQKQCREFLAICYGDIPSRLEAKRKRLPRYRLEWPVRALHLARRCKPTWLEARCSTDQNFMYTMHMVKPEIPAPDDTKRWGTKFDGAGQ
jgi:hypothetical protein